MTIALTRRQLLTAALATEVTVPLGAGRALTAPRRRPCATNGSGFSKVRTRLSRRYGSSPDPVPRRTFVPGDAIQDGVAGARPA